MVKPIKPVYDPDRLDSRLNITASTFNQLGQYTSSPGRRGYCYAELAVFRLDALALSVIATATWLAGWLGGWLSHSGIVSKPLNLSEIFFDHLKAPSF